MAVSEEVRNNDATLFDGLLHYTAVLLNYRKLIIISTVLAAVFVVAFSIVSIKLPAHKSPLPNMYRAYAIVLFQEGPGVNGVSTMLSAFGIESTGSVTSGSQLAMEVLRSRQFLDNIIDEFDIVEKFEITRNRKSSSRSLILEKSGFSYNRDSGALSIHFTDTDPVFAAEVVDFQVKSLEEWFRDNSTSLLSNELSLMEEKLNELSDEISGIEDEIRVFQKEHGVLDIAEIAAAQSALLIDLRTALNEVELEISGYADFSTIEDPALIILRSRRNTILTQIKRVEDGYVGSDGRRVPSIEELPQMTLDFAHLQADLALKTQLYQTLSERYEVTRLSLSEEGAFRIMEYAEIPETKIGPSRGRLCIIVTFSAFAMSIFIALLHYSIKNVIKDPEKKKILKLE